MGVIAILDLGVLSPSLSECRVTVVTSVKVERQDALVFLASLVLTVSLFHADAVNSRLGRCCRVAETGEQQNGASRTQFCLPAYSLRTPCAPVSAAGLRTGRGLRSLRIVKLYLHFGMLRREWDGGKRSAPLLCGRLRSQRQGHGLMGRPGSLAVNMKVQNSSVHPGL